MRTMQAIALSAIVLLPLTTSSQLIVDAGGARNLFYTVGGNDKGGLDGFYANVETGSKSAGVTYFGYPTSSLGIENLLFGADLKVTALDGLDQFIKFERWPQMQATLLLNKTWSDSLDPDHAWLQSITARVSGLYSEYALFDTNQPIGHVFSKPDSFGGSVAATYSVAFPWFPGALALSIGANATNNYASLPKVTVGTLQGSQPGSDGTTNAAISGGKTARRGALNHYHAFPLTLLYSHTLGQKGLSEFFKNLHVCNYHPLEQGANVSYNIILSPYASLIPSDEGSPAHSVGLNLVLRKFKDSTDPLHPEKGEISFPVALFLERQNAFSGRPDTTVGAALLYHFP